MIMFFLILLVAIVFAMLVAYASDQEDSEGDEQ